MSKIYTGAHFSHANENDAVTIVINQLTYLPKPSQLSLSKQTEKKKKEEEIEIEKKK